MTQNNYCGSCYVRVYQILASEVIFSCTIVKTPGTPWPECNCPNSCTYNSSNMQMSRRPWVALAF